MSASTSSCSRLFVARALPLQRRPTVAVEAVPKRAHQGWRYMDAADAPPDLGVGGDAAALPHGMVRELQALWLM